jgi:hypothetical protein
VVSSTTTTGSATLSWTPPTRNTDGSTLTNLAGYRIVYGNSPGSLNKTVQVANPGTSRYVVDNLATGTWYFSVRAYSTSAQRATRRTRRARPYPEPAVAAQVGARTVATTGKASVCAVWSARGRKPQNLASTPKPMKFTPPLVSAKTPKTLERCQTMKPTDMSSMPPRNSGSSDCELAQRQVDGPLQVIHQLLGMDVRALLGEVPLLALGNAIDVAQAFAEPEGDVFLSSTARASGSSP